MQFLISVIDHHSGSGTQNEMSAIKNFNDGLRTSGYFVFAGGLTDPKGAVVIDNRGAVNHLTQGPLSNSNEFISGFWIIDVLNEDIARNLAFEGSKACNRKVELREFFKFFTFTFHTYLVELLLKFLPNGGEKSVRYCFKCECLCSVKHTGRCRMASIFRTKI